MLQTEIVSSAPHLHHAPRAITRIDAPPSELNLSTTVHADVLSDQISRDLYDRYGPGFLEHPGGAAGRGNAREAWDEFKPYKRENKRTRARAATRTEEGATSGAGDGSGEGTSDATDTG